MAGQRRNFIQENSCLLCVLPEVSAIQKIMRNNRKLIQRKKKHTIGKKSPRFVYVCLQPSTNLPSDSEKSPAAVSTPSRLLCAVFFLVLAFFVHSCCLFFAIFNRIVAFLVVVCYLDLLTRCMVFPRKPHGLVLVLRETQATLRYVPQIEKWRLH